MTNSQRLAKVRACLLAWLANHQDGAPAPDDSESVITRESILIRDEFYCGRRFHTATHQAVWFIEEDQLKIYGPGGELVCVLTGTELDDQAKAANEVPDVIKMPAQPEQDSGQRRAA